MVEIQTNKMELTYSENIQQAAEAVATWPEWKTQNIKAVFSEPDIKVPGNVQRKSSDKKRDPEISV